MVAAGFSLSKLRTIIVTVIFLFISACAQNNPAPSLYELELSWNGDADLDLELWSDDPDTCSYLLGAQTKFGGRDEVGNKIGAERIRLDKLEKPIIVGAHFWAPGTSKDTSVFATLSIFRKGQFLQKLSAEINDDSGDLWLAFRIDSEKDTFEKVNRFRHLDL